MKNFLLLFFLYSSIANAQFRSLVINECMPNNSSTVTDQDGEYNDWLELYNNTTNTLNIEGYFLSDRKSEPTKFQFPSHTINPNDYLIVWLDKDTLQNGLHTNFKLSASSEQVYLFDVDTHLVDYVHFYDVDTDVSVARNTDGVGSFDLSSPSFNQTNGTKENEVVINEWMANNTNTVEDENGEFNDWIELYNNTNQTINLVGYFLSNKASNQTKYRFPNINILAHDYLVLWADEDTLQGELHLPFKLDSDRDDILLSRPDTSTIDYFFHHNVDSNITMARIPNGNGDVSLGTSSFLMTNQPYVSIIEEQEAKINIYPNPTTDYLLIENLLGSFEIFDIQGKRLREIYSDKNTTKLNVSNYLPGTYILKTNEFNFYKFIVLPNND